MSKSGQRQKKCTDTADSDSLVAMDALLQIGATTDGSASTQHPPSSSAGATVGQQLNEARTARLVEEAVNLPNLAATINALLPFNVTNMLLNSNRQSAAIASVHAAIASANYASNRTALEASSSLQHQLSSAIPLPTGNNETMDTKILPPMEQNAESKSGAAIRKEKVEEALRSKPQRGRKREDLSDFERMELTRTRNREHAKSTRIRKKARYQELLDREVGFLKMQETENLQSERNKCVENLISVRQQMLLSHLQHLVIGQSCSGDPISKCQSENDSSSTPFAAQYAAQLSELVEDTNSFTFDSLLPGGAHADSHEMFAKMCEWDLVLSQRLMHTFGTKIATVLPSLAFEIEAGTDGIAHGRNNSAFCRLVMSAKQPSNNADDATVQKMVLSGMCSFRFRPGSSRLLSMQWTTVDDHCFGGFIRHSDTLGPDVQRLQSSDTYERQTVHPSVVSLDHDRPNETNDTQEGPGMQI